MSVVALNTFAAFRAQNPWVMTSLRLVLGYAIAVGAGLIVRRFPLASVLQPGVIDALPESTTASPSRQGVDSVDAVELAGGAAARRTGLRVSASPGTSEPVSGLVRVIRATASDFLDVALFFVIGAAVAAVVNTAVDQGVIQPLAKNSLAAILIMMGLAGAMALCSSTDAFIAATFTAFPFTAKLAFLVFGPVFDVKLFFLYALVFRRKFILLLAVGLFLAVALVCLRLSGLAL